MKTPANPVSRPRKADRFLRYLRPPFNNRNDNHYFDRDHWWDSSPKEVCHDSALYELLRRHPAVVELQCQMLGIEPMGIDPFKTKLSVIQPAWLNNPPQQEVVEIDNEGLRCVAQKMLCGNTWQRSWLKLPLEAQKNFKSAIRNAFPGKGLDITKGVFDLTEEARNWARQEADTGSTNFNSAIRDLAESYSNEDRLILAIDTNFPTKKTAEAALKEMANIFWRYWTQPSKLERAHVWDWLVAIADFESEYDKKGNTIHYCPV